MKLYIWEDVELPYGHKSSLVFAYANSKEQALELLKETKVVYKVIENIEPEEISQPIGYIYWS